MFSNFLNALSSMSQKSDGMFSRRTFEIWGNIIDWFMEVVWYGICGILQLVYTVEQAFYWLAGLPIGKINNSTGLASFLPTLIVDNEGNLTGGVDFGLIFGKSENTTEFSSQIIKVTGIMLAIGVGMVVFFLAFAIIKGLFNNEGKTEVMIKSATWNTIKACCFMAIAPLMIMLTISTISWFISLVFKGINEALLGGGGTTIAETIMNSLYTGGKSIQLSDKKEYTFLQFVTYKGGSGSSNNSLFIQFYGLRTLFSGETDNFNGEYISKILRNTADINWTLNGDVSYSLGFIGGAFTLVALGLMLIRIGERLYNLIIDYILCIPSIATMPYDNGQRFSTWGQLFLGQLLNFTGSVIAMIVYLYLTNIVCTYVDTALKNVDNVFLFKGIIKLVIIIGGAFTCVKAGTIVSQLIGQVANQQENNSLQQSMHLASMGARATKTIAGAGAMAFGVGAMGTLKAMKQQQGTGNGTNGTKGGTGTGGTSGGIGGAINNLAGGGDTPTGNGGGTSGGTGTGGDTPSSKANVGDKLSGANTTSTGESSPLSAVSDGLTGAMAISGAGDIASQVADSGINTVAKPTRKRAFDKTMKTIGNGIKDLNSGVARGFVESARSSHMNPFAIAVGTASAFAGGLVAMTLKGAGFGAKTGIQAIGRSTWGRSKKFKNKVAGTENKAKRQENKILKTQWKQDLSKAKRNMSAKDYEKEKEKLHKDYKSAKKENANIHKERKKELKGEANVFFKKRDSKGNNLYTTKEKIKKLDSEYSKSPHELNDVSKMYKNIKQRRFDREACEKSTQNDCSKSSVNNFTNSYANYTNFKIKNWSKQQKKHGRYTIKG